MRKVSISELRKRLPELIGLVQHRNERIIIIRYGRPVAVLAPYREAMEHAHNG